MNKTILGLAAAAAVALTLPALAQQKAPEASAPEKKVAIPSWSVKAQAPGQYLGKDRLIGAKVVNKDGQIIGDIEDVIVNSGNEIDGVIMGVGGFLGAGEKKVGVRYSGLKFETKDGKTTVSLPGATKEVLAALEPYKRAEPKKSLAQKALEKGKELTDKTKETVKDAAGKASEASKAALEKGKEATKAAVEKTKEVVEKGKEAVKKEPAPATAPAEKK